MFKKFNNKNLVELKDLITPSFYICLTKDYRKFLIEKALEKSKDFITLAKEVGCCHYTLRNLKDKENSINALILERLIDFLNVPLSEVEKHVLLAKRGCSNRAVKIKLPIQATPELALLSAKVLGDGSICSDWRFHYTNNQLILIKEVINAVNVAIGEGEYTLNNRVDRKIYEIKFSPVIGYVLHLIGGPKGYKLNQEFKIPDWIINGDKTIKASFLKGIYDDESTVDLQKGTKRITLALGKLDVYENNLRYILIQIRHLLSEFNITSGSVNKQENYNDKVVLRFSIYRKPSFENFDKFIGFTHIKKDRILKNMIISYVDKHKTKKAVLETIRNSKSPLTIKEIANINGIERKATAFHLYNLLRENAVKRIEGKPTFWY